MMLRKPPWETGADATVIRHAPEPPTTRLVGPGDIGAAGDPDAPLITWRWQMHTIGHARAERSVTLAVDRWAASSIDCRSHDHVRIGLSYLRSFAVLETPAT